MLIVLEDDDFLYTFLYKLGSKGALSSNSWPFKMFKTPKLTLIYVGTQLLSPTMFEFSR